MNNNLAGFGSAIAGLMFLWAMFQQYFPSDLRRHIENYTQRLVSLVYPYIHITFHEYQNDQLVRCEVYAAIETYLASSTADQAKRLTASENLKNSRKLQIKLTMADHEEVEDRYQGIKVWWSSSFILPKPQQLSYYSGVNEKRFFNLSFHRRHRHAITTGYLTHVLSEGRLITMRNRQKKLYMNYGAMWRHIIFQHPATFDTIALEAEKKEEIINDLIKFRESEKFYARIGKAWKRGYLLYGPPGTGKSTVIAAMANFLGYDVYDLELTAVKDNTELRKLLIQTSSKSLIVIEDIDCSLDLTGQRKNNKVTDEGQRVNNKAMSREGEIESSSMTLSGLLNFIDGLWSACEEERLIVFTTNFKEKLDPALIRRGRMDMHIHLSYCGFEAFKVLAKNYQGLDSHPKFETIERMLGEVDITPADVAECLMTVKAKNVDHCLDQLIRELESAKENAKLKVGKQAEGMGC